jgi:transcriptional regulator with XRE-family HTH domain
MPKSLAESEPMVNRNVRFCLPNRTVPCKAMPKPEVMYPVTDLWRTQVRRWLADVGKPSGVSQAEMARQAKISPATLSDLLSGKHGHSVAVPLINKMVGLPPPLAVDGTTDPDDLVSSIALASGQLDEEDQRRALAFIRALQRSKDPENGGKPSN